MPTKPLRPCATPGCSDLVINGHCPAHRAQRYRIRDLARGNRHARGYGYAWQELREMILIRDPLCVLCLELGNLTTSTEADHIIPKSQGGDDSDANLRGVCRTHNRSRR